MQAVSGETKAAAYRTWLGFYKGFAGKLGWSPEELVQQANYFATDIIGALSCPAGKLVASRGSCLPALRDARRSKQCIHFCG